MSRSKLAALFGVYSFLINTILLFIMFFADNTIRNEMMTGGVPDATITSTYIIIAFICLACSIISLIAYFKLGKGPDSGARTALLVVGIVSIVPSFLFNYGAIASSVLLILAFSLHDKAASKPLSKKKLFGLKVLFTLQILTLYFFDGTVQTPMQLFATDHASFNGLQIFITLAFMAISLPLFILWSRKIARQSWTFSILKNWRVWLLIIAAVALIWGSQQLLHQIITSNSANQAKLDVLFNKTPLFITWVMAGLAAPIMEETMFRVGFFELLFQKHPFWAWLTGSICFALIHTGFTDLVHFPIYFTMGLVLGAVYWRTRRVEASFMVHALWNTLAVLLP